MKTFYLALDGDIIVDAIEYPHDGYIEVELPATHLPAGINGGWYRWDGTTYMLDEELKQAADEVERQARIIADNTKALTELSGLIEQQGQMIQTQGQALTELTKLFNDLRLEIARKVG